MNYPFNSWPSSSSFPRPDSLPQLNIMDECINQNLNFDNTTFPNQDPQNSGIGPEEFNNEYTEGPQLRRFSSNFREDYDETKLQVSSFYI